MRDMQQIKATMHPDFFSATFFAMRTKYQEEYNLNKEQVADYYFESLFIISVQTLLCCLVLYYGKFSSKIIYTNKFEVILTTLFTNLVLHFSIIGTIRNGINMTQFVMYHWEEFKNPGMAFMLGILLVMSNMLCEVTNILQSLSQKDVESVISKFVTFKLLIQIQDYYMRQRARFEIKNAV